MKRNNDFGIIIFLFGIIFGSFILGGLLLTPLYKYILPDTPLDELFQDLDKEPDVLEPDLLLESNILEEQKYSDSSNILPTPQVNDDCVPLEITMEPFVSNKCYKNGDNATLNILLNEYSLAKKQNESALASISIYCEGENINEDACNLARDTSSQAILRMSLLGSRIELLISQGE